MYEISIHHNRVCDFFKVDVSYDDKFTANEHLLGIKCKICWLLKDEIIKWLNDQDIEYKINYDSKYYYGFPTSIIFEKEIDAMLFKLSWL